MRLKRLDLVGFKSFAERTSLDLDQRLTAVVGPNGCGKSNIVDAVRWVLGEQSAKQLRGREMADLLFGGTDRRKPTGYAEVSLTLLNDDRTLPVDLDEVVITRRLYRSGESEYLLNRQACRLRDIRQLLMGTGLGMNAYSIIEQGKVDLLLSASAQERRQVFEEAAGIRQFRLQRHQCELKLQRTEQNLLRVGDIIEEVEKRLRSVKYQAAKARRYKEYTRRLKTLRARLSLGDYRRLLEASRALARDLGGLSRSISDATGRLERLDGELAAADAELARLSDQLARAERRDVELAGRIEKARADDQHQRAAAENLQAQALRHQQQAREAAHKLQLARERRDALRKQLDLLAGQVEERSRRLKDAQSLLEKALEHLENDTRRLEEAKTARIDLLRRSAKVQNELGSVEGLIRTLTAQRRRQAQRRGELLERARGARESVRELGRRRELLDRDLAGKRAELARLDQERRRWMERLDHAQAELAQARQRLSALAGRRELLARMESRLEGVAEAVKALLERARGRPGLHGLVADLLRVPRDYAAAVEAALGEAADYLVVDSRARARALARQLRAEAPDSAGRVGFLCLDRADPAGAPSPPRPPAQWTALPGYVGLACDLVEAAPVAQPAIRGLLERTVVVRDLRTAEELLRTPASARPRAEIRPPAGYPASPPAAMSALSPQMREEVLAALCDESRAVHDLASARAVMLAGGLPRERPAPPPERAVTLAGEVITRDGRLVVGVGGAASGEGGRSAAGGRIWRLSELEHLARRIAETEAEIDRRAARCAATDERLRALEARHAECAARCEALSLDLLRLAGELERSEREAGALEEEADLLARELEATDRDLAEAAADRDDLARRRGDLEADQERLRERTAALDEALRARSAEVGDKREAVTRMKVALAEAEARRADTENALSAAEGDLAAWSRSLDAGRQGAAAAREQARRAREAAENARRSLEELARLREEEAGRRNDLLARREECAGLRERLRERRDRLAAELQELDRRRQSLEVRAGEVRVKREDLVQRTREELGMDLAALYEEEQRRAQAEPDAPASGAGESPDRDGEDRPPEPRQAERAEEAEEEDLESLRAEIAELRTKIERLGGVNMDALEELDQLEMRATFLNQQRDDLLKAKADLERVIRKINRQCREMFSAAFAQIREHFQDLFRKLFGGGKADVFLEPDENGQVDVLESGIEIVARPPGKEPRVLSLLSGGEKVLTAVALLLAVFRSNPSPFCLLDEVDAALDESSIGRFVEVLRGFLDRSQFIIVTHNKRTMAAADVLYGVTMQEPGVSRVVTVHLKEVERRLAAPRVA